MPIYNKLGQYHFEPMLDELMSQIISTSKTGLNQDINLAECSANFM